ncbi:MAG: ATP-grasp domain-containing protein [Pseudolabrys sp.]
MISSNANAALADELDSVSPIGLPALCQMAFDGLDLAPVWNKLVLRVKAQPSDAAALLDLSAVAQLQGRPQDSRALQTAALNMQRVYRRPAAVPADRPLKLLAFMAPGDFMANTPLEFMLEGSSIELDMMYVVPGTTLPMPPEHDVALVAIDESDETAPVLREIAQRVKSWPRPVVNAPDRIAQLTRAGTWEMLKGAPGIVMPMNARIDRTTLTGVAAGDVAIESVLDGAGFPIIARPSWSQAGVGLVKLDNAAAIDPYLCEWENAEFYVAPFVDYASGDGLFRKYRIAMIEGRPFAAHMAISQHWMIHYLNANMRNDAGKRAEEAHFMANFDSDFAVRHAAAFKAIAERSGLEYLPLDCGETPDGKLLVFEAGTAMIVHSMDPPDLFAYKRPQMEKVFKAFQTMLHNAARAAP